jgi:hypothetical protein
MITRDLFSENYNGEYDDEAGMAKTNLVTIARAAQGLLDTIDDQENLPEWVQEKIAKVQGMMVTAWDYLESQEAQGIDPKITDEDADPNSGYAQLLKKRAELAARKKLQGVAEEKVRLDPKCWDNKKIGNPKTKVKGGVRVNNCVPKEGVEESHTEVKDKEGRVVSWKDDTEWHKAEKNKQGQPKDPRGVVTHMSDVARRKTASQQGVAEADMNKGVQAKTDDKLLAYYAQRKAEKQKQQQGATATSQPVESQSKSSSFQAKPMSMSLEDWKKEILAKYPNARFATERRPNGSTLAGELAGGHGQDGVGIYSPSTGEVRIGPTGSTSNPLRIHPKQQGVAEGLEQQLVTIYTNPAYKGATVDDRIKKSLPVTEAPFNKLQMWENGKSMKDPKVAQWVNNNLLPQLKQNGKLGPLVVWNNKGKLFVIDGNHRFIAYQAAGYNGNVPVQIVPDKMINIVDTVPGQQGVAEAHQIPGKDEHYTLRNNIWTVYDGDEIVHEYTPERGEVVGAKKLLARFDDEGYDVTHVISPMGVVTYLYGKPEEDMDEGVDEALGESQWEAVSDPNDPLYGKRDEFGNKYPERSYRVAQARKKKQHWLSEEAQLGALFVEVVFATDNNVVMSLDQILDFIEARIDDPELTALEYMHDRGIKTENLMTGLMKRMAAFGLKKLDIFNLIKSSKSGASNTKQFGQKLISNMKDSGVIDVQAKVVGEASKPDAYQRDEVNDKKIGNMDADAYDSAMARLKQLAGSGPMKTVYDPATRRYKNVPTAVQPAQQPRKK